MSDQPTYEWVPLTEAERDAMVPGMTELRAKARDGDVIAQLVLRRLDEAEAALKPEIDRLRAEMEAAWETGSLPPGSGGLADLIE